MRYLQKNKAAGKTGFVLLFSILMIGLFLFCSQNIGEQADVNTNTDSLSTAHAADSTDRETVSGKLSAERMDVEKQMEGFLKLLEQREKSVAEKEQALSKKEGEVEQMKIFSLIFLGLGVLAFIGAIGIYMHYKKIIGAGQASHSQKKK